MIHTNHIFVMVHLHIYLCKLYLFLYGFPYIICSREHYRIPLKANYNQSVNLSFMYIHIFTLFLLFYHFLLSLSFCAQYLSFPSPSSLLPSVLLFCNFFFLFLILYFLLSPSLFFFYSFSFCSYTSPPFLLFLLFLFLYLSSFSSIPSLSVLIPLLLSYIPSLSVLIPLLLSYIPSLSVLIPLLLF